MTQIGLCDKVGVARSTMWTMENGFRPTPEIEEALREALDWGDREDEALAVLAGVEIEETDRVTS